MNCKIALVFMMMVILQTAFAPPVTQNKKENETGQPDSDMGGLEYYMEYHRYLKEVVNTLESDDDFRKKLESANESEIKSGKIADELQFVSHHVRTKLDELKRLELVRLKELTEKKKQLEQGNDIDPTHHHLDQSNPHTFEIEDLKKLIKKTTHDLATADKLRKEEFKHYEMEKEYQKQQKLNSTNGEERKKLQHEFEEKEQKHKKHQKLHEPGHKDQLEEVWEEQDEMDQQDFNPKTFFMLHDIDGNGLWDQEEVKALFIKELDKMYEQGAPEDDMRERAEEMERMRESVFEQMDRNVDGFIDFKEFLDQTKTDSYKSDHGWQGLDEQPRPYSDEELAEYIQKQHGAHIPQYDPQNVPPGGYQQVPPGAYQQVPPGGYQQAPPGAYQQVPPGGYQQVPPGGYQQVPPGGYQQVPPGGQQQVPSGGHQQIPPNQQFHPGQVPQMAPQQLDLNTNEIHPEYPNPAQYQQNQQYQPPNVANSQYSNSQQQQQQYVPAQQNQQPNVGNNQPQQNPPQYQQPNVANNQKNIQHQQPNVANNQPNIPHQQPNVQSQQQYQQPNIPQQHQNNQPVAQQIK